MSPTNFTTFQQARTEAERCLYCFDAPCMHACPSHIDIPKFIAMIRSGNTVGAAKVIKSANAMANVCGKICPEEIFCQSVCNRTAIDTPIAIRELHYFATQSEAKRGFQLLRPVSTPGAKVAVIGAGPAGLACAFELAKLGHQPTVFDSEGVGGVPKKSIPAFRLSENELQDDIRFLSRYFSFKQEKIGEELFNGAKSEFKAFFLALGLGLDRPLGVPGERLEGVIPVLRFLEPAKKGTLAVGKRIVIVGGGNVSLDAAATAKHLGAREVILLYRRGEKEMKVWKSELAEARAQGVEIRYQTIPVEVVGTSHVQGIRCRRTQLSDTIDASGRPIPIEVPGSDYLIDTDTVIVAIGQELPKGPFARLTRTPKGYLQVDAHLQTSERGVFAGGDAVSGEGTIVQAVAHGKQAAHEIHQYICAQ